MSTIFYLLLLWGNEDPPPGIVDLPEKVEAGAGRLIRIEAKTTGKQIRWHLEGSDPKSGPARALSPVQSILLADGETMVKEISLAISPPRPSPPPSPFRSSDGDSAPSKRASPPPPPRNDLDCSLSAASASLSRSALACTLA